MAKKKSDKSRFAYDKKDKGVFEPISKGFKKKPEEDEQPKAS